MLNELKEEMNMTVTENGAKAYRSTLDECVDFFAVAGSVRYEEEKYITDIFTRAYSENPDYAMRILFYTRDVRGGLGERYIFRVIIKFIANNYPESIRKNLKYIAEYGRYDDYLELLDTAVQEDMIELIKTQLDADIEAMNNNQPVSLLAKWLPSVNTSSIETREKARKICRLLKLSQKDYRKKLSALRSHIDVLEKRLCAKDYTFDYSKQPSKALCKYRNAFGTHDAERYNEYIENVLKGTAKMNAGTIYPYEIVGKCFYAVGDEAVKSLDATWKSLPDYTKGENAIAVVDGSGSMYSGYSCTIRPIDIALSLGIYFAERNEGVFKNHFITFSRNPRLVEIKNCNNIVEKVRYCATYNEVANTDIEKVFLLILKTAVKHKVPQQELPKTIYIISDMKFDSGCVSVDKTIFESMKESYRKYGYELPAIVYWNVYARDRQFPVKSRDTGAVLVSGASPSVFSNAINRDTTPEEYMLSVINSARYSVINA